MIAEDGKEEMAGHCMNANAGLTHANSAKLALLTSMLVKLLCSRASFCRFNYYYTNPQPLFRLQQYSHSHRHPHLKTMSNSNCNEKSRLSNHEKPP